MNDNKEPGFIKQLREENNNVIQIERDFPITFFTLEKFLALDVPNIEMIMHPWLPEKGVALIHAKRGVGKTLFCLCVSYAIATGKPFIGFTVPRARKVLYIDGEMRVKRMQIRISNIAKMFDYYDTNENFSIINPDLLSLPLNLYDVDQQQVLNNLIIKEKFEVVVIDNISTLMYGFKENEAQSWEPIQAWELQLRKMGVSVIRVMHSGKQDKVRGTSKVEDIVDTTIYLKHPNDYDKKEGARFIVEFEKSREFHGEDANSFEMQLKNNPNGSQYWDRQDVFASTYNLVIKYTKEGYKNGEIADLVNISRGMVTKHTKRAKAEGLLPLHF